MCNNCSELGFFTSRTSAYVSHADADTQACEHDLQEPITLPKSADVHETTYNRLRPRPSTHHSTRIQNPKRNYVGADPVVLTPVPSNCSDLSYRGIRLKSNGKYSVRNQVNHCRETFGHFDTAIEAAEAYDRRCRELGRKRKCNFKHSVESAEPEVLIQDQHSDEHFQSEPVTIDRDLAVFQGLDRHQSLVSATENACLDVQIISRAITQSHERRQYEQHPAHVRQAATSATVEHDLDQRSSLQSALENVRLEIEYEGDEISVADDLQIISDAIVQWFSSEEMVHERKQLEQSLERARQALRKAAPPASVEHDLSFVDDVTEKTFPSTDIEDGQHVVDFYCSQYGINNSDPKDVQPPSDAVDTQVTYPVADEDAVHTVIIVTPLGVAYVKTADIDTITWFNNNPDRRNNPADTNTDIDPMLIQKLREIGTSPEEINKLEETILNPGLLQVSMFSLSFHNNKSPDCLCSTVCQDCDHRGTIHRTLRATE